MTTEGATWQDGIFVAKQSETLDEEIKAVQRKLERAKKGSNRRRAHREDLGKLHRKKAEQVKAQAHKASRRIANCYGHVAIEDLDIRKMTASAKGCNSKLGMFVGRKASLNRETLRFPKRLFRILLEYKVLAAGGKVIAVPAYHTSQTCAECGHVDAANRPGNLQSVFVCTNPACGHADNADRNAARNILAKSGAVAGPREAQERALPADER
jgi:putative transposase